MNNNTDWQRIKREERQQLENLMEIQGDGEKKSWVSLMTALNSLALLAICLILGFLFNQLQALRIEMQMLAGQPVAESETSIETIFGPITEETDDESTTSVSADERTTTKTSGVILDAIAAAGGKLIVLRIQSLSGLSIYDIEQQEIVGTIRLGSDNFLYTAGGNTVLVYFPENNLLQSWDLTTLEKLKTKSNPMGTSVLNMTMGHSNGHEALIRYAVGSGALDRASMYILDTINLEILYQPTETNWRNGVRRDNAQQRANGSLSLVSEWTLGQSPSGLGLYQLNGANWGNVYEHDSAGYIAVGDDGFVYTQAGTVYNSMLTPVGELSGQLLIPSINGGLFLGIAESGDIQVYISGQTTPLGPVAEVPEIFDSSDAYRYYQSNNQFGFDRHVIFAPTFGSLVIIPASNDRLINFKFDLESLLEASGVDFLVVTSRPNTNVNPGESWSYQLETISSVEGVTFELEFAPEGMAISNEGLITWTAPEEIGVVEQVVVLVENTNGEATYHNFELLTVSPQ